MRDLSADASLLSLNTITVREQWSLAECIDGCVRHGIGGISPWRDKLDELGADEAARRIGDAGLTVSGLCRGGMFPAADAAGRQAALDDNRRAVDDACTIGARCLVLVVGGLPPGSHDIAGARGQVRDGIAKLLEHSRAAGMPLAIEPLHPMYAADRACVNTLAQANDLCDQLGDDGLGIAVDLYHVWWDPDLAVQITRAGKNRLLAFHVCDWLVPTTDLLLDRGMMGDGVIDIRAIRQLVEAAGYDGFCEVEILSQRWWSEDADTVLSMLVDRHRTVV
ncbi:MAG: sugar phosphate isomerase/epimerase [Alphaproteobacteria bacterium]|nr:sugar phosphate isomerase/epimerase [Alphaproteobacteria bacterium]